MTALPRDFGRYRLLGLLGSGGMAEVYRAETLPVAGVTRRVAIKRLLPGLEHERDVVNMLQDEARIWVRLQHPNIVSVVEFGHEDGAWFLALELIEGLTASDLVYAFGKLPAPIALTIAERVARALAYAHELAVDGKPLMIVHRDVKPANVLLSRRGEVKLTDFGIARATDRVTRTQSGIIKGSLHFLSPEQARGEPLDGRSDLFSLGCALHKMLTGRSILDMPRDAMLMAIARGDVPPPDPSLPPELKSLVAFLTAARREQRPSGEEVVRRIRELLRPASPDDLEPELGRLVDEAAEIIARRDRERTSSADVLVDKTLPGAPRPDAASGAGTRPRAMEISGLLESAASPSAPEPMRVAPVRARPSGKGWAPEGGSRPITRLFEMSSLMRRPKGTPKLLLAVFGVAVAVLAVVAIAPFSRFAARAQCATARAEIDGLVHDRKLPAAAAKAPGFAASCPADPDATGLALRIAAMSGDDAAAIALLPPPERRSGAERWAAASIALAARDFGGAEREAAAAAHAAGAPVADLACLAAAAAIDQDHPERAEGYLASAAGGCARILGAAALAQTGQAKAARAALDEEPTDRRYSAAWESARALLDLDAGDLEGAAAEAKSASGEAGENELTEHPFVWYREPSPRDSRMEVLRVGGPFDDAGFLAKLLEGDVARARGNLDLATRLYDEAIARTGRISTAEVREADILGRQGRPQLAKAHLLRALQADPKNGSALVALALLEESEHDPAAAGHAAAALALLPDNKDARRLAAKP